MVVNHETSKIPRLCRDVFARYGGNDAWNVSAHYVYRKKILFPKSMYERQVLLAYTIIRDLPRLRDTEGISRDRNRFLSINFGALRTLKPITRLPGRVMVSRIIVGNLSRTTVVNAPEVVADY
jgi:hypothetical protein